VYRVVVVTVPRQSGKTKKILAVCVDRAVGFGIPQMITYAAQSRIKARQKWEDDHVLTLQQSSLAALFRVRKTTGNEAIIWRNGSHHGIESTTPKAGHGDTIDLGVIDEAFAQVDNRTEQAFRPAMITRPQPQLWVVSTAGTDTSVYLRGKVEAGRLAAELGLTDTAMCYFEWSAPNGADPADPATWYGCMPALGRTIREDAIRADFESMDLADFRRAYLNQWLDAFPEEWLVIPAADWQALLDPRSKLADPVAFGVDMTPLPEGHPDEQRVTSIGAAGRRADGCLHVEVIEHRPGTAWVVPRLAELVAKWSPCAVVADPAACKSLITPLDNAGIEVLEPSVRDVGAGCQQFLEAVTDSRSLRHLGQQDLYAALAGARSRVLEGGSWAWARKATTVDISPLVACTLAAWGHGVKAPVSEAGAWVI